MDDPKTLDDYVKVMTAIRDSDWNGNGENDEITTIASANNMHNYFYGSFGLRTRGAHHDVVDVDPETGELRVYFQHENFRKYVEFMTMMYQEKLIYQEIFTEGDKQSDVFNQTNRLSMALNTIAPGNQAATNWYTVNWSLEGPDGYAFHTQTRGAIHSTGNFVITCDCPRSSSPWPSNGLTRSPRWNSFFPPRTRRRRDRRRFPRGAARPNSSSRRRIRHTPARKDSRCSAPARIRTVSAPRCNATSE